MIVAAAGPAIQLAQSITFRSLNTLAVIGDSPSGGAGPRRLVRCGDLVDALRRQPPPGIALRGGSCPADCNQPPEDVKGRGDPGCRPRPRAATRGGERPAGNRVISRITHAGSPPRLERECAMS